MNPLTHSWGRLAAKRLLYGWVLLIVPSLFCSAGTIVLDDFDRSDFTNYRDPFGFDYNETFQVGELQTVRRYRLAQGGAIVQGTVSIDPSSSVFLARIDSSSRRNPVRPDPGIFGVLMTYSLRAPTDLRAGDNDSLVFEFDYQHGAQNPTFFRAIIGAFDTTRGNLADSFQFHIEPPPTSDGPFRVIMPFSDFTPRGGGAQGVYLHQYFAHTITIDYYFFEEGQFDWSTSINRIYFANAASIPEPGAMVVTVLGAICCALYRSRRTERVATGEEGEPP